MSLKNMTVLITGSSRGLGNKIALSLADEGANLIIHYLKSKEAAFRTVEQIKKRGVNAIAVQTDVCDWNQVEKLFQTVSKEMGRIDGLVNNVGDFMQKSLSDTSVSEWQYILNSNLNSAFYCCKAVLPYMRKNGFGRIINIAVANADRIHSYHKTSVYGIAKTGLLILTRCLAIEEAENGITVNSVSPGLMDNGTLCSDDIASLDAKIPMHRIGKAQDLYSVIHFLLTSEAGYITGSNIHVSGGWGI
jgi:NAD(P)-dependent dehydrogenase (short-subunit alcohol dehydrogenase family)